MSLNYVRYSAIARLIIPKYSYVGTRTLFIEVKLLKNLKMVVVVSHSLGPISATVDNLPKRPNTSKTNDERIGLKEF